MGGGLKACSLVVTVGYQWR